MQSQNCDLLAIPSNQQLECVVWKIRTKFQLHFSVQLSCLDEIMSHVTRCVASRPKCVHAQR